MKNVFFLSNLLILVGIVLYLFSIDDPGAIRGVTSWKVRSSEVNHSVLPLPSK